MADTRELTFTDKKKLEEELAELIEAKKRVAEDIKVARGFGDLSENAEYDEAKAEEARVYGRIAELENILGSATFVDFHLVVPGEMTVAESHCICDRLEDALATTIPGTVVTIHVEPGDKAKARGVPVL